MLVNKDCPADAYQNKKVIFKSRGGNIKHHQSPDFDAKIPSQPTSNHSLFMEVNTITNIPYSTIPVALHDDPSSHHFFSVLSLQYSETNSEMLDV